MARFLLPLAVLAVSTSAPLIRYAAPAPAMTVAALRVCLAGLLLSLMAPGAWRLWWRLPVRERLLIVAAGFLLALHFASWISSLYWTSTAASVALVATQPIFAALFARALGDVIHRREVLGMACAAIGCAVLASGELLSGASGALVGDVLAIAGAATAAGYLLLGRRMRASMPLVPYLALVNVIAGVLLLVGAAAVDTPMLGFSSQVYLAIALAAIAPSLIGHSLLNLAVRRSPAHVVALAVLAEPIGASLMTWVAFSEVPPAHAVLGGVVIIAGIALGVRRQPAADHERTNSSRGVSTGDKSDAAASR